MIETILDELNSTAIDDSHIQPLEIQVARLEMMLEVSRALNSTLDLDILLQSIINVATQLTDTEAASILLLDEKKEVLYFQAVAGEKQGQIESMTVPLDSSIAGWIVKSGEPVVIYDLHQDERHFSEVDRLTNFETRSILGVPLMVKENIIGAIEVINKHNDGGFTGGDSQTLTTLATQAAIAIENARLFRQSDQLVNVFYELSVPMDSIIGRSEDMLSVPDIGPDDMRAGLESINREATRLSHIVNSFLDLAQIETGRVSMDKRGVDLLALTQEVMELLCTSAQEKGVTLSLNSPTLLPSVPADRERLKQVILNLIDNGIKYNRPDGTVEVILTCNEIRMQLSVRDTGRGIPTESLAQIFDKFYRVDDHDQVVRGAGLGLALARKIIEAHQGDIWVESELGEGSTFTFSLPLEG